MFKFSNTSKSRREGVDSRLIEISDLAITISKIDFGIPEFGGLRTAEDQHKLYISDLSKCDGYDDESHHQHGNALDVFAYVDGKVSYDPLHMTMVAAAMLQAASQLGYKLTWGGLFKTWYDRPHFQLVDE